MAKAIVNELKTQLGRKVNFYYKKGPDCFSMWFGESERNLRSVFNAAKSNVPSVIFFDEIDGLCPSRDSSSTHGTDAYSAVVTCFLGQMDAVVNGNVFVIAATNRVEQVDPAVLRPGRFDKHLAFGFPDEDGRKKIIKIHTGKWKNEQDKPSDEVVARVAQRTVGFSGADLEKLTKDAVYVAIEANGGVINNNFAVKEEHWMRAVNEMQPTAIDSFGSSLFVPTAPSRLVSLLITPTVAEAVTLIAPKLSSTEVSSTYRKSFLFYMLPEQSESFLNHQIIQGVLLNPIFNKMSMFELSVAALTNRSLTGAQPSLLAATNQIINQALDSENPAVVVIFNINRILELFKASKISSSTVVRTLARVRGPKISLIATSSVVPAALAEAGVSTFDFFNNNIMHVNNPNQDQLTVFFNGILEKKRQQGFTEKDLNELATTAARISNGHSFDLILNLSDAMVKVIGNKEETREQYEDIFTRYRNSRL